MNDLARMLRQLRRDGYSVVKGKRNHWKIRDAAGRLVAVTGSTPSDRRSLANLKGQLRRVEAGR